MALHKHAVQLASDDSVDSILKHTLDAVEFALGFDHADFTMVEDGWLRTKTYRGIKLDYPDMKLNGPGVIVKAANLKKTLRVSDTRKEKAYFKAKAGLLSQLAVPILTNNETAGVISVESTRLNAFTMDDAELLETLSNHVASAIVRMRREEDLQRYVSLHQATLESTGDGVLVVDKNGTVVTFNRLFIEMWHIPNRLLSAKNHTELLEFVLDQLEYPEQFRAKVEKLYSNPEEKSFDVFTFRDGRAFERYSQPQRLGDEIIGRVWSFRDVTEGRRAEARLRLSEERYHSLFDRMLDGIYLSTHEGRFIDVNSAFVAMFRYSSKQEMLEIPDIKKELYFSPEERGSHVLDTGKEEVEVYRMRRKDGSEIWVEDHGRYVHDEDGNVILHEGILRDVTERKQMEEAVHRRAEELDSLQKTLLEITARHELPALLNRIVERAAELLGAPAGGLYLCDLNRQEVRCVVAYNTKINTVGRVLKYGEGAAGVVAQTGKPLVIDDYREWKDRAAVFEQDQPFGAVLSAPLIWQDQVLGVIHLLRYDTKRFTQEDLELLTLFANHASIAIENGRFSENLERMVAERTAKLTEIQNQLLRAERLAAIGETAAMVGHDLRNPLQAISTATYVLRKNIPNASERAREMFQAIENSVEYSDRIVEDLLEYAQDLSLDLTQTNPKSLVRDALLQLKVPENVGISDLTSDAPMITVDVGKIRRIIINLVENAFDAMPKGGKLEISDNMSGNNLEIKFKDTGIGIPEDIMQRLWKPLITTKPKGIGLGLAICKSITEAHGGSISVESKAGVGATFTLKLPIEPGREGVKNT